MSPIPVILRHVTSSSSQKYLVDHGQKLIPRSLETIHVSIHIVCPERTKVWQNQCHCNACFLRSDVQPLMFWETISHVRKLQPTRHKQLYTPGQLLWYILYRFDLIRSKLFYSLANVTWGTETWKLVQYILHITEHFKPIYHRTRSRHIYIYVPFID